MSALWAEFRAAVERLGLLQQRVSELERTVLALEQQLRDARGN